MCFVTQKDNRGFQDFRALDSNSDDEGVNHKDLGQPRGQLIYLRDLLSQTSRTRLRAYLKLSRFKTSCPLGALSLKDRPPVPSH